MLFFDLATALRLQAKGKPSLMKKQSETTVAVFDYKNLNYLVDITLGGEIFSVEIDTGSADLWISKPVPNAKDAGFSAGIMY
ncbi:hypothetical protein M422DRAFT_782386, partial [Sphaerobolus stellatus SS14]